MSKMADKMKFLGESMRWITPTEQSAWKLTTTSQTCEASYYYQLSKLSVPMEIHEVAKGRDEMDKMPGFVVVPEGKEVFPVGTYDTLDEAIRNAKLAAAKHKNIYYVLKPAARVEPKDVPVEVTEL